MFRPHESSKEISLQILNDYIKKTKLRDPKSGAIEFSFLGKKIKLFYSAAVKLKAAKALKKVITGKAEPDSLLPHIGPLTEGKLAIVYESCCATHLKLRKWEHERKLPGNKP